MNKHLFFILVIVSSGASAQEYAGEFGAFSDDQLKKAVQLKTHEGDTLYKSLVLFDKINVEVTAIGTKLNYDRRLKLFHKSSFEQWGIDQILVPRSGSFKVRANIYNLENGEIVRSKLGNDDILKVRHSKTWDKIGFALPNLREGSVVEIHIEIFVDSHLLPTWSFQYSVPALWSEYYLTNIYGFGNPVIAGPLQVQHHIVKKGSVQRWYVANPYPFTPEPFMPHEDLCKSTITFWNSWENWPKALGSLWGKNDFRSFLKPDTMIDRRVMEAIGTTRKWPDDAKKIVEYVKSHVEWNTYYDHYPDPFSDVLKAKSGTVADINLLLAAMLRSAGYSVRPVLLTTRDYGVINEEVASYGQFNYVICHVVLGTDTLLLDATERQLSYRSLPARCLNGRGLCISPDNYYWINIVPPDKAKTIVDAKLKMEPDGTMKGKVVINRAGYAAHAARAALKVHGDAEYDPAFFSLVADQKHFANQDDLEKPFEETYEVNIQDHTTVTDDLIYLNPFLIDFGERNQFVGDHRQFPVQFPFTEELLFLCNIEVPIGYEPDELPASAATAIPGNGARCFFSYAFASGALQITMRVQMNKTDYSVADYHNLKEFFGRIVAKRAEQVVLKKK